MRRVQYQAIAEALRERVGREAPGALLPSESELSTEFGVSRVTIRRALEVIRDEGLIAARQGFGWYVATVPVRQQLEHLGTIEAQLERNGHRPARRVLEFAFLEPPERVREVLETDQVLRVKRLNLSDGEPFAIVTVWCRADMAQTLSRRDVEQTPFYELLDVELRGASQTIGADAADRHTAELLNVPVGAPVLRCQRITTTVGGEAVLVAEHVFPAHRTEFVVDLPQAEPSTTPAGLRLVD